MLQQIQILPGLFLSVDSELHDVVCSGTALEKIKSYDSVSITLKQQLDDLVFSLDISLETQESAIKWQRQKEEHDAAEHQRKYIDYHSRAELLEDLEERVVIYHPRYGVKKFTVWGYFDDAQYGAKELYYEEPHEQLQDFKEWLAQNGYEEKERDTRIDLEDITTFYHIERKKKREMQRLYEDAAKSAREKRFQRNLFSRFLPMVKYHPFRVPTASGVINWKPPLIWNP